MSSLRVSDLIRMAQRNYELNERPYAKIFPSQMKPLLEAMGHMLVDELTFDVIEAYQFQRIAQGRARDTINKELGGLSKGFKLGVAARLLRPDSLPVILRLRPGEPRTGFLYIEDFRRLCEELSPAIRDVAEFAYWSGWRRGEILNLRWEYTKKNWAWCRSKNGDTKFAPLEGHLRTVIDRRFEKHCGEWVFHRDGRRIKSFRDGWAAACRRAGLPGIRFHDMRRSFCRNGIRAGIDRDTVKKLSGHRSDAVFTRYNIQDERDLIDAAKKLGRM